MSNQIQWIGKWKIPILVILFVLVLSGVRMAWISYFDKPDQPYAVNGELDLRDWTGLEKETITLDGQWAFYSHEWLPGNEPEREPSISRMIPVPGSWNAYVQPEEESSFGYGSYRLRILVDPELDATFSIRVSSVRSSSALYVNGRLLAKSGEPGDSEKTYVAMNLPYTASFSANGQGVIEVIVQAANYIDIREGGIVRSIKFGTEQAIARETQLSVSMQQLAAVVFLIHAVYALILYLMGTREKRLLYFALLTAGAMVMDSLGSEEKLLHQYLSIGYDWGFKLVHFSMVAIAYALLQCVAHKLPAFWSKVSPGYSLICGGAALLALLLPAQQVLMLQPLFGSLISLSVLVTIFSMLRISLKDIQDNLLLLFSLLAFTSNFVWWSILVAMGIKGVYYPFDLIVSTACYASVWFKHYFQVHAETKSLAAKLQRADKMKDQFLANTSHELRNPLHGILNISQGVLERERYSLKGDSVKDLEVVLSVGRRMSLILNDLLDTMRLKENAPRLHYSNFSIHSIATGVLDMLLSMREGTPVRLVNEIPDNFPMVYADENRVIQIVFNLLHNAVKYTNEGEVAIRAQVKEGLAHIAIVDTGIGMDEETIRRVFEPYEQASPDKTMVEGGFGLGLSISKQLVELHGETLQVSSVPGQGSEFVFTLRIADPAPMQGEAQPSIPATIGLAEAAAATTGLSRDSLLQLQVQQRGAFVDRPRILLVDDDPVNLKVLESILSTEPYNMMSVTSGKQALEVLDNQEWDLIISDVMMPQMSGYELTRKIRDRFTISELPILLLTARSQAEDIVYGFLAGANEYVTKPVEAVVLRSRVKALTDVKKSVRERLRIEAAWLQAQIQPHFLFNTLTAIRALSEIDLSRMRNMLEAFGNYLRDKFKLHNIDEPVPVEDELSAVRAYLYIEQERYEDRLRVVWEIDECNDLKIPLLTIQPLVENSIRHGIMKRRSGGKITIRISSFETHAEISVKDDGVGMDERLLQRTSDKPSDSCSTVGLINTDLRLKRRYGKGLQIKSRLGYGTTISFIVYK
ncbi:ATP-binding protein [Cohnella boryungensis]|uniref:histidine kinase n=1 Tax=Cohnella boryungensis TaxID=768479 RepID=A0ABV8SKQ5_9BACL